MITGKSDANCIKQILSWIDEEDCKCSDPKCYVWAMKTLAEGYRFQAQKLDEAKADQERLVELEDRLGGEPFASVALNDDLDKAEARCAQLLKELHAKPFQSMDLVIENKRLREALQWQIEYSGKEIARGDKAEAEAEVSRLRKALEGFKNTNGHWCFIIMGDKHSPECEQANKALASPQQAGGKE